MDAIKRFADLVELARSRELPHSMTMEKCLQLLGEMHQMGMYYAEKCQDDERAFVFLLRYISIVVEELPKHPCFASIGSSERHSLDVRTLNGINTAEQLKRRIRQRYEREKELGESVNSNSITGSSVETQQHGASTSRANVHFSQNNGTIPTSGSKTTLQEVEQLLVPDQMLCPYVRCQAVSMQPIVFQRVIIPNNIPELFLAQQKATADVTLSGGSFAFAFLYGRLVSKSVIVSQLLPCSLDTISSRNFRRFVPDPDSSDDLPIVGCICSSLAKACQAGFFRVCQISEMVCIVCPPGPNRTVLIHLVNMSPSGGASPVNVNSLASAAASSLPCGHQHITDSIVASVARIDRGIGGNSGLVTTNLLQQPQQNGNLTLSTMDSGVGGKQQKENCTSSKISPKIEPPNDEIVALSAPEAIGCSGGGSSVASS